MKIATMIAKGMSRGEKEDIKGRGEKQDRPFCIASSIDVKAERKTKFVNVLCFSSF